MSSGQTKNPVKFNFDTVFGAKGSPATAVAARARSSYSADEVEQIRLKALADGKAQANAEAMAAQAAALGSIAHAMSTMLHQFDQAVEDARNASATLALAVGKKLADAVLAHFPAEDVESLIAECMHKMHNEPRLVIRVSSQIADELKAKIDGLAEQHGFTGRVIILVEQELRANTCRIEWADGGVERNTDSIFEEIETAVNQWRAQQTKQEN